ncbi:Hypothetical protein PMN2A_2143 [Prochlorococcus marinus str. NATL2A]|uniref:Uncharacterized protein n=1 Tax=Prochlorococcus marinus (strain NATL2A) TaxID=59920 RepID=A7MDX6_PROMT|nr:Hypothetical protein PMN2A_2143 [Prochlorococcus marinus str. NATL2A]
MLLILSFFGQIIYFAKDLLVRIIPCIEGLTFKIN